MRSTGGVLEREEYIEQAYFFRVFRERLKANQAAQEILERVHEEILTTTRLPLAIQYLATELKHSGLLGPGFARLRHYFTPFQTFVIVCAEKEGLRFSLDTALEVLEAEARYRSGTPTRPGLFMYQLETLSRNHLGFDEGLTAIADDPFYDQAWRDYVETLRRNMGEVEFADLVYVRSELYLKDQERLGADVSDLPPPLFGEKEGKIAKASHGRDPLFLFAALQRQLGYPVVPRAVAKDDPLARLLAFQSKLRELEQRIKLLEAEIRGQTQILQTLGQPELFKDDDEEPGSG
jgi:hypothetical protein